MVQITIVLVDMHVFWGHLFSYLHYVGAQVSGLPLAPGDLRKFPKNYRKFPDIPCVNIVSLSCWDQFRVLDVFQDLVGHSGRMYLQNVDCLLRRVLSFTIQWYRERLILCTTTTIFVKT